MTTELERAKENMREHRNIEICNQVQKEYHLPNPTFSREKLEDYMKEAISLARQSERDKITEMILKLKEISTEKGMCVLTKDIKKLLSQISGENHSQGKKDNGEVPNVALSEDRGDAKGKITNREHMPSNAQTYPDALKGSDNNLKEGKNET